MAQAQAPPYPGRDEVTCKYYEEGGNAHPDWGDGRPAVCIEKAA